MILKNHKTTHGILMALCDSSLLGTKIREDDFQLDLSGDFYKGEEKTTAEMKKIVRAAYIINAVGEETIAFLLSEEIIKKEEIKKIKGVPYTYCMILANEV